MSYILRQQLQDIAYVARNWAKTYAEQVTKDCVLARMNAHDLGGMCAIAAGKIHVELGKHNIDNATICVRNSGYDPHCFNMVDGYIIDVTASQFNMPDIIVEKRRHLPYKTFWRHDRTFTDIIEFREFQFRTNWIEDQIVLPEY